MFSSSIGRVDLERAHCYYRAGPPLLLLLLLLLLAYVGPARLFFNCSRANSHSQIQVLSRPKGRGGILFTENTPALPKPSAFVR
jgi:hypothetical protein